MQVKKSITLSREVWEEARKLSSNFSRLVEEALRYYIRQRKIEKAKKAFGAWKDRVQDSVEIVNEMRRDERDRRWNTD